MKKMKSDYLANAIDTANTTELMAAVSSALRKSAMTTRTLAETFSAAIAAAPMAHIPFGTVMKHRDTVKHHDTHGLWCETRIMVIEATTKDRTATLLRGNDGETGNGAHFYFSHAEWEIDQG